MTSNNNEKAIGLLTEKQVAERLAISTKALQRWRLVGQGPAFVKVGRCVRYEPQAVEDYVSRARRTSTSDRGQE